MFTENDLFSSEQPLNKKYGRKYLSSKTILSPNVSPKCNNCGETLDLGDTKNGKDREFCRYGGRPECGECARFYPQGTEHCPDCTIQLKTKLKCEDCNRIMKNNEETCPKCEKPVTVLKKCSRCNLSHNEEEVNCRNCKIKLRTPACVKEYSMYVTKLNQVRNEIMADPKERLKLNLIYEIFRKKVTISKAEVMNKLEQIEITE